MPWLLHHLRSGSSAPLADVLMEVTPSEDPSTLLAGLQTMGAQQLRGGQVSCCGAQPRGRGGLSSWGRNGCWSGMPCSAAGHRDARAAALATCKLKTGKKSTSWACFPTIKSISAPTTPLQSCPNRGARSAPPPAPNQSHIQAGDESAHPFTKCFSSTKPPSLRTRMGLWMAAPQTVGQCWTALPWEVLHLVFAAGQWSQQRVKAAPPTAPATTF